VGEGPRCGRRRGKGGGHGRYVMYKRRRYFVKI
jgi:hypothetical protein